MLLSGSTWRAQPTWSSVVLSPSSPPSCDSHCVFPHVGDWQSLAECLRLSSVLSLHQFLTRWCDAPALAWMSSVNCVLGNKLRCERDSKNCDSVKNTLQGIWRPQLESLKLQSLGRGTGQFRTEMWDTVTLVWLPEGLQPAVGGCAYWEHSVTSLH